MPRAVQLSWPSLAAPGFVAQVLQQLIDAGAVAKKLSIEWTEGAKPSGWQVLALATRDGRHLGARMGVGHGASAPQQLMLVHDIGLDCVKVDARHLRGVASDEAVRSYAIGLLALIHGLSLQAVADGVDDEADLGVLWSLGFDAANGRAARSATAEA